jgi:GT2 family glycosyltransferase
VIAARGNTMPRLSIVIVSFNSLKDLEACLRSITQSEQHVDYEVVVVDNASSDGTVAYVRERWPGVHLIEAGGNLGFARANNIGIRQTFGELVLLLNPDTIVPPRALGALVEALDGHPEVAIVGPRIVDSNGRAELSFGPMISPLAELRQKMLVAGHERGIWPITLFVERATRRTRLVDWVTGACLLARRADVEAVGLMDERFFLYTEDVDLCASVRARGRRVMFTAEVEVIHRRGTSGATAPTATQAAYRRSQLAFYRKHHPAWAPVLEAYLKVRGKSSDTPNIPKA